MGTTPTTWTRIWRTLVVVVLAVGVASATTVLEWGFMVTLVLTMAFIGGTYGALWGEAFPDTRHPVLNGIVAGPLCSLGMIGVIHLLGAYGGMLLLGVALSCPWVLGPLLTSLGKALGHRRDESGPRLASPDPRGADFTQHLADLPASALARAWADTERDLRTTHSTRRWMVLAEARGLILDEVERRDPDAFAAWLATAPGAGTFPRLHDRPSPAAD
jgi:hypothetical protein